LLPRRHVLSIAAAVLIGACATRAPVLTPDQLAPGAPAHVELDATPFIAQERYQCGPASLAMLLQQSGVDVSAEALVPQVYLPERKGSLQAEMLAAGRRFQRIPYVIDPALAALTAELRAGRPVLVLQNLGLKKSPLWHYAVVIGYSVEDDRLILRSGTQRRQLMPGWLFVRTWKGADSWGMVLLRPGELPERPDSIRYLSAVAAAESRLEAGAALRAYEAALTRWPNDTIGLFGRANALHELGRLDEAAEAYQRLISENPSHMAALNNLAQVYLDQGCYSRAQETIDGALAGKPSGPLHSALMDTHTRVRNAPASTDRAGCDTGE
jgi:tetratricopeptide (TPR) repeat protein